MRRSDGRAGRRAVGRAWNLIVDPVGRSGPYNMATDEALLDDVARSGGAYLRLYRWDPPTLSIGRNQPNVFESIPVVRRPTGGQAVWHEHEVTYAVAAPISFFGSLRDAYCEIHERLARALQTLGVGAVLADRPTVRPRPTGSPLGSDHPTSCFASSVGGEILVNGRKLVGSAQVRKRNAFLQHGSILLGGSQRHVAGPSDETTLSAVLGRLIHFDDVVSAVIREWGESLEPVDRQPASPAVRLEIASLAPR